MSRLPETIKETPKTINVVPKEVIEQQQATSLEQILKNVPGITISTGEGNGGQNGDQFRIRGLSAKGDIYVDGLRDFGAYKRDSFNTESVEVIKGPSGETFGVGNIGGLINQSTKRANLNTSTSIDQGVGSASTYRTTVDSNIRLNDTSAVRINGVFQNGRVADRDHVDDDRRGFAIDFGTGLGTSTEWHLNYSYLHRSGAPDYGAAGAGCGWHLPSAARVQRTGLRVVDVLRPQYRPGHHRRPYRLVVVHETARQRHHHQQRHALQLLRARFLFHQPGVAQLREPAAVAGGRQRESGVRRGRRLHLSAARLGHSERAERQGRVPYR
jgi:outer membrane receptor protein involved in Fe transport